MICSSDKVMYASQVMFIAVAISDVFAYIHTQKLRSGAENGAVILFNNACKAQFTPQAIHGEVDSQRTAFYARKL